MKLYLDDWRYPEMTYQNPKDWILIRDPFEFFDKFKENFENIDEVSFDHDLEWWDENDEEITGYYVVKNLIGEWVIDNNVNISKITAKFHTANPDGKINMETYWNNLVKNYPYT